MTWENMAQMLEEKEFSYKGKIIGNPRMVLDEGDSILKVFFNPEMFEDISFTIEVMRYVHPDLILEEHEGKHKWVRMKKIDFEHCGTRSYEENLSNYLSLREIPFIRQGEMVAIKGDMSPRNLIYQKSDGKPYFVDWDQMKWFHERDVKDYYIKSMCDPRWQNFYGSYPELVEIIERMW